MENSLVVVTAYCPLCDITFDAIKLGECPECHQKIEGITSNPSNTEEKK